MTAQTAVKYHLLCARASVCTSVCLSIHTVVLHVAGGLDVKILPRTAKLDGGSSSTGPPPEQDIPLDIPKRTAVYIEQVPQIQNSMTC